MPLNKLQFFDPLRTITMAAVILYHAVGAYSTVTPHWSVHDGTSLIADGIRHLFDVFMMPVFFFVAGFFAVPSLTRQGTWKFLSKKVRRIGTPWFLAILILVPLMRYGEYHQADQVNNVMPFLTFWTTYLKSVGTFQIGLLTPERAGQMHFWFLSLLLAFFILYGLWGARSTRAKQRTSSPGGQASVGSIALTLAIAGIATSLVYFIVLLLTSEMSWITLDRLFQFQPTALVVYIASFIVGIVAHSRRWFDGDRSSGRLSIYLLAIIALGIGYFALGHPIFTNPAPSDALAPVLLLAFSFVRTALCIAIILSLVTFCRSRKTEPSPLTRKVAAISYEMYLVHIFFVVFLQNVLMVWQAGPPMAKSLIVFLAVFPLSYWVSRVIHKFPRSFIMGFCALFFLVLCATL